MSKKLASFLLMLSVAGTAHAVDPFVEQAIMDAIHLRQRVDEANNLRRVTVYYLGESQGCSNVAVATSIKRGIDHYRVCQGQIEERDDVAPAAPNNDRNYRATVVAVGKQALLMGDAVGRFEGYLIQARRLAWIRHNQCGIVDIIVTYDGMLVEEAQPRVCL